METTKTSNFTCRSKSLISIFFTCQISACELQQNLSLAIIWQLTCTHKLPKLCSATLNWSSEMSLAFKCPLSLRNNWRTRKMLLRDFVYKNSFKTILVFSWPSTSITFSTSRFRQHLNLILSFHFLFRSLFKTIPNSLLKVP